MSCVSFSCPWPVFSVGQRSHSTASCFLPLLLEKDFRPPKGVIPNAKQHWQQPSFLACIFNPPCATEVAFWFFPSLFTRPFPPSGFLSHTLTLLLKIASCFCSHPSNHSLLEFNTVLSVFTSQRPNTRPGPHNRGAVASASTGGLANNQQPTVGLPSHTSATSSQAHLLSILASIPADRYDVNPLKSPGTYL